MCARELLMTDSVDERIGDYVLIDIPLQRAIEYREPTGVLGCKQPKDWCSALDVPTDQEPLDRHLHPVLKMISRDQLGVGSNGHQRNCKDQH